MEPTKILIVEDEKIVAKHLEKAMKHLGYHVPAVVSTGETAIQKAEETRPDLVLIDILLKGKMDGIVAAGHIHKRFKIPVVYLTAFADEFTLQRARQSGPYGYLIKPFQERELHSTIKMALQRFSIEKELETRAKVLTEAMTKIKDGVIATDNKGLIIFINPVAQKLTGFREEESLGMDLNHVLKLIHNITHRETRVRIEHFSTEVTREGVIINLENQTLLESKNGEKTPISALFTPLRGEAGEIFGGIAVIREIDPRHPIPSQKVDASESKALQGLKSPLFFNMGTKTPMVQGTKKSDSSTVPLTRREIEVLSLLSRGLVAKEIAESLNLSNATVRTHIQRILQKMKAHTKLEAVILAIQKNFIEISTS